KEGRGDPPGCQVREGTRGGREGSEDAPVAEELGRHAGCVMTGMDAHESRLSARIPGGVSPGRSLTVYPALGSNSSVARLRGLWILIRHWFDWSMMWTPRSTLQSWLCVSRATSTPILTLMPI